MPFTALQLLAGRNRKTASTPGRRRRRQAGRAASTPARRRQAFRAASTPARRRRPAELHRPLRDASAAFRVCIDPCATPAGRPSCIDPCATPGGRPSCIDPCATPAGRPSCIDPCATPAGRPSCIDPIVRKAPNCKDSLRGIQIEQQQPHRERHRPFWSLATKQSALDITFDVVRDDGIKRKIRECPVGEIQERGVIEKRRRVACQRSIQLEKRLPLSLKPMSPNEQ